MIPLVPGTNVGQIDTNWVLLSLGVVMVVVVVVFVVVVCVGMEQQPAEPDTTHTR